MDAVDALKILRHDANLSVTQNEPCPDIGTMVLIDDVERHWGDIDCDDLVNPVDSLKTLRHDADLSVMQMEPCPDPAEEVTVHSDH